jgi:hypothetical protein
MAGAVLQYNLPTIGTSTTNAAFWHDLTSVSVNPGAYNEATPRMGGFAIHNRADFANIGASAALLSTSGGVNNSTAASQTAHVLGVLRVPERTFVKNLKIYAVPGATAPNHSWSLTTATSATASDWSTAELTFGARAYKRSPHDPSYTGLASAGAVDSPGYTGSTGEVFGALTILSATGSLPRGTIAALPSAISASSSTPWAGSVELMPNDPNGDNDASAVPQGYYFPYGGFVTMMLGPLGTSITMASSALTQGDLYTDAFTGVWHFTADCDYIPE